MAGKNKKSQNKSGMALACWILGFLVILIIFLVKQDEIIGNLKSTRFFDRVFGKTPTFVEKHEEKPKKQQDSVITIVTENPKPKTQEKEAASTTKNTQNEATEAQNTAKQNAAAEAAQKAKEEAALAAKELEKAAVEAAKKAAEEKAKAAAAEAAKKAQEALEKQAAARQTTSAKLYFVAIGSDGSVSRKEMIRTITKTDSPLSENIRQLLTGPNQSEKTKGCMSLVPDGTRLLSATVHDGTAFLSFSEEFKYNRLGVEGYLGQLMQIVYTATEFSTVDSVQFLIQGKKEEFLGSDGVWIGSPLSRSSFTR